MIFLSCAESSLISFNPRTRDGCEKDAIVGRTDAAVSIHAPVMGANGCCRRRSKRFCFNPRTRDGCEELHALAKLRTAVFQSTHP